MSHLHLLARASIRKPLLTTERAVDFLRRAVALAGMNVIGGPWAVMGTVPGNEGVSATAILDYSSTNLHEWPDEEPARLMFDLYTCGPEPDLASFAALFDEFEPVSLSMKLINRDAI